MAAGASPEDHEIYAQNFIRRHWIKKFTAVDFKPEGIAITLALLIAFKFMAGVLDGVGEGTRETANHE